MKQKILILGLGAFGFVVAKHLGENNPDTTIYASEVNPEIYKSISETGKHPYFFEDVMLPGNIELVGDEYFRPESRNENIHSLQDADIIISIIPCQFVGGAFAGMKEYLKPGVTILNLSKGIDNVSMQTVSEKLADVLSVGNDCNRSLPYNYAYLAGGMIAQELVDGKMLGADIVTENAEIGETLKKLFKSDSLDINLKIGNAKNTELYAALKNILALVLGYYEGQGAGASSRGYYLAKLLGEMKGVIALLNGESQINFTDYALSGDLIATCFGGSRNRLLGNILGQGTSITDALADLKSQKKIAEGYETLKGVYKLTQGKDGFDEINTFGKKYL